MSRCAKELEQAGMHALFYDIELPCARCWQIWNVQAAGWMRWS